MRIRRLCLFGAVLLVALSIGSAAEAQAPTPIPPRAISIMGRQFLPKKMTIAQGTTLTWVNLDPVRHKIGSPRISSDPAAPPPAIPEVELNPRTGLLPCAPSGAAVCSSFAKTFDTAGTYPVVCSIHRGMASTIVVREPERTSPRATVSPPPTPVPGVVLRRVSILGRQFSPRVLRIKQFESVRFANGSTSPHTATSISPEGGTGRTPTWDFALAGRVLPVPARPLTRDDFVISAELVFPVPGNYYYQCMIHPGMVGQINVAAVNPDA